MFNSKSGFNPLKDLNPVPKNCGHKLTQHYSRTANDTERSQAWRGSLLFLILHHLRHLLHQRRRQPLCFNTSIPVFLIHRASHAFTGWLPSISWNRISIMCIVDVQPSRRQWHRSQMTIGPSELGTADNHFLSSTFLRNKKHRSIPLNGNIYIYNFLTLVNVSD